MWRTGKSSYAEGFSTILALVCFALLLQITALCAVYLTESARLLQASSRSQADLLLIQEAREMAEANSLARMCSQGDIVTRKTVQVQGKSAILRDETTYIRIEYEDTLCKVYYDAGGLISIEWN